LSEIDFIYEMAATTDVETLFEAAAAGDMSKVETLLTRCQD
jgi:hypothetical protein